MSDQRAFMQEGEAPSFFCCWSGRASRRGRGRGCSRGNPPALFSFPFGVWALGESEPGVRILRWSGFLLGAEWRQVAEKKVFVQEGMGLRLHLVLLTRLLSLVL